MSSTCSSTGLTLLLPLHPLIKARTDQPAPSSHLSSLSPTPPLLLLLLLSTPSEPNHFRPVALTSHLMETMERIVLRSLRPPM